MRRQTGPYLVHAESRSERGTAVFCCSPRRGLRRHLRARNTRTQLEAALKRAGRKRGIPAEAERLRGVFRADYPHQPPMVEDALGKQISETRRAERLALLERFIGVPAEAERCAYTRPSEWEDTDDWYLTTRDVMYRLWVADRLIRIQFPLSVHDAAHKHFLDLNRTVWHGLPDGESVRDYLEDNRAAFLDAARVVMSGPRDSPGG